MHTVRTLAKGQIVIPAEFRKQLIIQTGTLLEIRLANDHLELWPVPADPIAAFCGSLAGEEDAQESLAEGLMEEHRQEVKHGK